MPTARTSEESASGGPGPAFRVLVLPSFRRVLAALALGAALAGSGCDRPSVQADKGKPVQTVVTQSAPPGTEKNKKKPYDREGYAVWYVVPVDSLANRRAGKGEFTAAHNQLPLGSLVRVTHLANGTSVIVRITDRGITKRGASIDLCKPAAEKLGMISEGMARVRMEELPDDTVAGVAPDSKVTAAHP
jgi:rare lipoprotein A